MFSSYIHAHKLPLYDFTLEDGNKMRVTVIIVPIKLVEFKDGSLGVSFACTEVRSPVTLVAGIQKLEE